MKNKSSGFIARIVVLIVAIIVLLAATYLYGRNMAIAPTDQEIPEITETSGKASMILYKNSNFDLEFQYPSNLYFKEQDTGSTVKRIYSIVMVENTEENRDVLDGKVTEARDGPPSITVDIYENEDELSSEDWLSKQTTWVQAMSGRTLIEVNGRKGITYTWDGLYQGRSIVMTYRNHAYVFSVSWLNSGDQLSRDFDMIMNTVKFSDQ